MFLTQSRKEKLSVLLCSVFSYNICFQSFMKTLRLCDFAWENKSQKKAINRFFVSINLIYYNISPFVTKCSTNQHITI